MMQHEVESFSGLLARQYDARGLALHPLVLTEEKRTYRVDREHGGPWTLRAYPPGGRHDRAFALGQAAVLLLLGEQGYPAPRLVRARDGASVVEHQGWQVTVTTFIEGAPTPYAPASLGLLGEALGRLHALGPAAGRAGSALPTAGMLPANEIRFALGQITAVEGRVPEELRGRYDTIVSALHGVHHCDDLPRVVIHNDCHPGNSVRTPAGRVVPIDWEGAGVGPAVIDVGFLLVSCDGGSPWTPPLPPDPGRVRAVVDGYCRHQLLAPAELDRLPDAMRFRSLVAGACLFAGAVREGRRDGGDAWWWRRYQAVDELAARARSQFEAYLPPS